MHAYVNKLMRWQLSLCLLASTAVLAHQPVSLLHGMADACAGMLETGSLPLQPGLLAADAVQLTVQSDPSAGRGRLTAIALNDEGGIGGELWHSSDLPPLSADQLHLWPVRASGEDAGRPIPELLDWLRGEPQAGLPVLARPGVLVGRSLLLVHPKIPASLPGSPDDADWQRQRENFPALVLAGDGHGLLWAFSAGNQGVLTAGDVWQTFLPASQQARLMERAQAVVTHQAIAGIEGELMQVDLPLGGIWHTLVVGSAGAGGKGLFVLRLFDASLGARPAPLWEGHPQREGWESVGHIHTAPRIAWHGSRALLITGNGFGSREGQAVLIIADAATGELIRQLPVGRAGDNGLAAPQLLLDAQGQLQAAWAGDLHGNLWRFELAGDSAQWHVAFAGQPLFAAGTDQPITQAAQVLPHPHGGHMLLFGTGRWLEAADFGDATPQSVFGIWDKPGEGPLQHNQLQPQVLSDQGGVRHIEQQLLDWSSRRGWQLNLPVVGGRAEKLVQTPQLQGHRLLLQTRQMGLDGCSGQDWVWLLDGWSGGVLPGVLTAGSDSAAALLQATGTPAHHRLLPVAAGTPLASSTRPSGRLPACQPATPLMLRQRGGQQLLELPESCRWQRLQWRQLL